MIVVSIQFGLNADVGLRLDLESGGCVVPVWVEEITQRLVSVSLGW